MSACSSFVKFAFRRKLTRSRSLSDEVQSLMAVNCYSLLHAIQTALPALRNSKGSIIMVSSGAAEADYAGWGPYSASKAYMNSLAR